MKTRLIRPSFWEYQKVGAVSRDARLLLLGCRSLADDAGRLGWDAGLVREQVFGFDRDLADEQVAAWMDEVAAAGLVVVYRVRGRVYAEIAGFVPEQRITRPVASRVPGPESADESDAGSPVRVDASEPGQVDAVTLTVVSVPDGTIDEAETPQTGACSADEVGAPVMVVAPSSEEDEMGLYDEPADPFAPVAAPLVRKAQETLPGVPTAAATAVVEAPVVAPAKRSRQKKAAGGEQQVLYPPEVTALCERLAAAARENLAKFVTPELADRVKINAKWLDAADKMLRLDGFTPEQVESLIDWTAQDEFWRTNIRSMPKLREKADVLAMKPEFLRWAVQHGRATRAAANGVRINEGTGRVQKQRAVDTQFRQDQYTESW